MIEHEGIVLSVESGFARVQIVQTSACSACHVKSMCMAAESRTKVIEAEARGSVCAGDQVMVEVEERMGWKAVVLAFVVPFVLLFSVIVVLSVVGMNEGVSALIAIGALVPYYILLWVLRSRLKRTFRFVVSKREDNFS